MTPVDARRVRKLHKEIKTWRKLRVFLTLASMLGLGVSGTLLVVHAPENIWAQVVGVWPPIAVFLIIEILSRVPVNGKLMATGRVLASLSVAGAGLYLSYGQQIDLMEALGYDAKQAIAFPWTIDGFMIVSTLSMVEVARRIRTLTGRVDLIEDPEVDHVAVTPAVIAVAPMAAANDGQDVVTPTVSEDSAPVEPVKVPAPVKAVKHAPRRKRPARATQSAGVKRATTTAQTVEPTLDAVVEPVEVLVS